MTVDLSTLSTAAERWEGMAKEFHKQEIAYDRDVHGIRMEQTWSGLSADVAGRRFDIALQEFQKAQTEAKAVASLLRDAHHAFAEVRKQLKSARADAIKAGMAVSRKGATDYRMPRTSVKLEAIACVEFADSSVILPLRQSFCPHHCSRRPCVLRAEVEPDDPETEIRCQEESRPQERANRGHRPG
ncbi:hypothetical protein ACIRF8_05980 [Streptomyces sp. NPDC102406]|uniref:hypothetical protein n=1 Tax=Streptomyces sp. NPDC102406 TaxID=3366171 RepID=UPI0037F20896